MESLRRQGESSHGWGKPNNSTITRLHKAEQQFESTTHWLLATAGDHFIISVNTVLGLWIIRAAVTISNYSREVNSKNTLGCIH